MGDAGVSCEAAVRSGVWTVLDEDLAVVAVADGFLRQVRFGRDSTESTTKSYAGSIALFLRWCVQTGRTWQAGAEQLALFMSWLQHAGPAASGAGADAPGGVMLVGPGAAPGRSARRVNAVLTAVRGMWWCTRSRPGRDRGIWCRRYMRWPTPGTCREPPAGMRPGCCGACGPGAGCTNLTRTWTGPVMSRSSRSCGRAGPRGTR